MGKRAVFYSVIFNSAVALNISEKVTDIQDGVNWRPMHYFLEKQRS